jgi:hypothetical protein
MSDTPDAAEILETAPRFRCADETLTHVYRMRWASLARNLVRTGRGWVVTEFHQPGPGRAHGTVNAAAGHHILEGRWLGSPEVVGDYLRFWYTAPEAEPHRYTEWIAWAAREHLRLHDRWDEASELLPGMVATFDAWTADSLHPSGLYWAHDLADAMEFSISGDGFRPTLNSYQYGNADAIAEFATRAARHDIAERFSSARDNLRERILERLYDPELELFATLPLSDDGEDAYLATADAERRMPSDYRRMPLPRREAVPRARRVRELIGFAPWYVGLPGEDLDAAPAVAQLTDPEGFAGSHGLRTAERRHPRYGFAVRTTLPRFLCRWNGPSWPFATSQTLTALARIARTGATPQAAPAFLALLRQYAASHLEPDGGYWLDEDLDPDTGAWLTRDWRRRNDPARAEIGRDYQHSTFADLVLGGLLGIDVEGDAITTRPLPSAAELGWFEVRGLRLHGLDVELSWHPEQGMRLTAGGRVARRRDLGPLAISASSDDIPTTDLGRGADQFDPAPPAEPTRLRSNVHQEEMK